MAEEHIKRRVKFLREDSDEIVFEVTCDDGGKTTLHVDKGAYYELMKFKGCKLELDKEYIKRQFGKDI
jgi:hypothetical protein